MGERLVYASFTAPAKRTTHPTTKSAMVDVEDPGCSNSEIDVHNLRTKDPHSLFRFG